MNQLKLQDLLEEHAQSVLKGTLNRDKLLAKYKIAPDNPIVQLLDIAERLDATMTSVRPSEQFMEDLYNELVGPSSTTVWGRWARRQIVERLPNIGVEVQPIERWRQLPFRVQLAAAGLGGLTLFIIAARRAVEGEDMDVDEALDILPESSTA